ncbi:MAG TPA: 50S ribosomal protein L31 [Candidatus Paceibacterota bacterium]|nr:50S ribosomal protein L31 [Candidatus Paceibacterota bacterium]HOL54119.1 50S ribosomal protein L31 [Candidatus Paceibacterota bacterium]HON21840.1 50S ribosomal protein L31 [Candidatus Paceibacterota bacterium]HOV88923.1 50S ribosomal protein L31 [Candidatus Paceibacterota bacterium]HPP17020.1 50S ribosomal protein L31 [Candidatus Paceibacterota bacterium]
MKKDIHPKYYPKAKVKCACGNVFEIGATVPEMEVEICSACHPFYTGKEKIIDTAGRVDKFKKRLQKHSEIAKQAKPKTVKKAVKKTAKTREAK